MAYVSLARAKISDHHRARASVLLLAQLWSCADLLDIPSEPRLVLGSEVPPSIPMPGPASAWVDAGRGGVERPISAGGQGSEGPSGSTDLDVTVDGVTDAREGDTLPGAVDAGGLGTSLPSCPPGESLGSAPVDIVLVLDNAGSMAAEVEAVELNLAPRFADRLDASGIDYRIVLLSRHRTLRRTASSIAQTSICIANPLSGLPGCPSAAPVLSDRFFQHGVTIDGSDSFDRLLGSYAEPDPFALTERGWSEWLRLDSLKVFVEITEANAAMPLAEFRQRLSALGPEHFGSEPSRPAFVFHSMLGMREKALVTDTYTPEEPIERSTCASPGTDPDSPGESYQELSRVTGGLRLPLCPVSAIPVRLEILATDVIMRSFRGCPPTQADSPDVN